jgi:hypothetical protein
MKTITSNVQDGPSELDILHSLIKDSRVKFICSGVKTGRIEELEVLKMKERYRIGFRTDEGLYFSIDYRLITKQGTAKRATVSPLEKNAISFLILDGPSEIRFASTLFEEFPVIFSYGSQSSGKSFYPKRVRDNQDGTYTIWLVDTAGDRWRANNYNPIEKKGSLCRL